jgi:ElaB/YqjD/DUF883 family membrane-anchored ribosome-binding protein
MMDTAVRNFDRASGKMAGDFRTMISDGEELLKAAATVSGEGFSLARTKFEDKLRSAKATLVDASQPLFDGTRRAAGVTDVYVKGNPWTAVGVAIAAGVLIGFLAGRR